MTSSSWKEECPVDKGDALEYALKNEIRPKIFEKTDQLLKEWLDDPKLIRGREVLWKVINGEWKVDGARTAEEKFAAAFTVDLGDTICPRFAGFLINRIADAYDRSVAEWKEEHAQELKLLEEYLGPYFGREELEVSLKLLS